MTINYTTSYYETNGSELRIYNYSEKIVILINNKFIFTFDTNININFDIRSLFQSYTTKD